MKNFKKGGFGERGDSRGNDGFRGNGPRGGAPFPGRDARPSFSKKPWEKSGGNSFNPQMHPATCANCGKPCEVPFRPTQGKDVYCKDCFVKTDSGKAHQSFDRNDRGGRNDRPSFAPKFERPQMGNDRQIEDLKRQVETIHAKLDRAILAIESMNRPAHAAPAAPAPKKEVAVSAPAVAAPKAKEVAAPKKATAPAKVAAKAPAKKAAPKKAAPAKKKKA